ncbi:hypothetical protein FB451DRAFT_1172160 [Mycena latifolia]|nr:hypothetical protein FB451DRAFT_1172160 [Mycena latifolia]
MSETAGVLPDQPKRCCGFLPFSLVVSRIAMQAGLYANRMDWAPGDNRVLAAREGNNTEDNNRCGPGWGLVIGACARVKYSMTLKLLTGGSRKAREGKGYIERIILFSNPVAGSTPGCSYSATSEISCGCRIFCEKKNWRTSHQGQRPRHLTTRLCVCKVAVVSKTGLCFEQNSLAPFASFVLDLSVLLPPSPEGIKVMAATHGTHSQGKFSRGLPTSADGGSTEALPTDPLNAVRWTEIEARLI